MSGPLEDPALPELVGIALEQRDRGEVVDLTAICSDHPHLLDAVRAAVEQADRVIAAHREPAPAAESAAAVRTIAGRYRLVDRIGSGAMGVVYAGEDLQLKRTVAIKVLRAAILDEHEARQRFEREAEALAAVQHASVVTVYDRGTTEDGEAYLVMELLEGLPLSALLEFSEYRGERTHDVDTEWVAAALGCSSVREPSFLRTAVQWTLQLAEGLAATHARSIVHRDVKPSNVFLTRDGNPVLLDFGIAAQLDQETITREGGALGTPAYMAPESVDRSQRATDAVDVYGLTATLYHLVTLRPPFVGTPSQVLSFLGNRDPVPASRLRKGLPRDLQAILDTGMAIRPKDRYASATELATDLQAFLDYRPVKARPTTTWTRAWHRVRRSSPIRAVAVTTLALTLVLLGWQWNEALTVSAEASFWDVGEHFPPNVTLLDPENRRSQSADEYREVSALFDAAVEHPTNGIPVRVLRAHWLLDHDDRMGAARDMRKFANAVGGRYADAVASRYERLAKAPEEQSHADLTDLPDIETDTDALLSAYLAMRIDEDDRARQLLSRPGLADSILAELLRMILVADQVEALDRQERIEPAFAQNDRIARFEERLPRPLAHTRHHSSWMMLLARRFRECAQAADDATSLCPQAYTSALNGGLAAYRCGFIDEAMQLFEGARRLRPTYIKPFWDIFFCMIHTGDLERAAEILAEAPFADDDDGRWRRASLEAVLASERALKAHESGDSESARALAAEAFQNFSAAEKIKRVTNRTHWGLSQALANAREQDIYLYVLRIEEKRPLNWRTLHGIANWIPDQLDEDGTKAVRRLIHSIARRLSFTDQPSANHNPSANQKDNGAAGAPEQKR